MPQKLVLLVVAAILSLGGALTSCDPPPKGATVGVQFHCTWDLDGGDTTRDTVFAEMANLGVKWVRMDIGWHKVQPTATTYTFARNDTCVTKATNAGLHVLETLWNTPGWANGGQAVSVPPTDPATYGAIAKKMALRYDGAHGHGLVDAWEVWNEPDPSQDFWAGTTLQYVNLVKAATPQFHAGNPSSTVVVGGPAGNNSEYIAALYTNGLGHDDYDVISVHPYQHPSTDPPTVDDTCAPTDYTCGWGKMKHTPVIHQIMVDNGDGDKNIWFTEFGWATNVGCKDANGNIVTCDQWDAGVSETTQGTYFTQALDVRAQWSYVTNVFWYDARDNGTDAYAHYDNFGLLRHDDLGEKASYPIVKAYLTG